MGRSDEIAGETHEILEPHRLESNFRAERAKLGGKFLLEQVIAGHDGHWRRALEDVENLWALAAWRRSAASEEPTEQATALAA